MPKSKFSDWTPDEWIKGSYRLQNTSGPEQFCAIGKMREEYGKEESTSGKRLLRRMVRLLRRQGEESCPFKCMTTEAERDLVTTWNDCSSTTFNQVKALMLAAEKKYTRTKARVTKFLRARQARQAEAWRRLQEEKRREIERQAEESLQVVEDLLKQARERELIPAHLRAIVD
jgi:hypothetical protein